jgi:hypothetical protein
MGDVIQFPRPKAEPKPLKSDNLTYPTQRDLQAAQDIIDAMALRGLDIEIIPVPVLCGDCIRKGASECQGGPNDCGLYGDGA